MRLQMSQQTVRLRQKWDVPRRWRPSPVSFLITFLAYLALGLWWAQRDASAGAVGWYTAAVWTLPLGSSVLGLWGGVRSARRVKYEATESSDVPPISTDELVVVVPTIGRLNTYAALQRVVGSYDRFLPPHFTSVRIDIVIEEGCEARSQIAVLATTHSRVRLVEVPRGYRTANGTRFKARASHYAHERRIAEGEARRDVWILHMDDDTGVGADTAIILARFVAAQRAAGDEGLHLGQGVLTYPREYAINRIVWLADAIRPGCDISLFARSTGSGSPHAGLHGELLLVRASEEAAIGWDFGPRTIVEDATFALHFCERYPGRSGWFSARSYGASPSTVRDLIRQRERWMWGLLELVVDRSLLFRRRLLLIHNVSVWACAPLQHPLTVLALGLLIGDPYANPAHPMLVPLWGINVAFLVWLYWEGLKVNALASREHGRRWWEPIALVVLIPLFTLWEVVGVAGGLLRFLRRDESAFTVIAKSR